MKSVSRALALIAGAVLLATTLFALVSAPGLISDRDSTVPVIVPPVTGR